MCLGFIEGSFCSGDTGGSLLMHVDASLNAAAGTNLKL